jgi:hypothetical protein
VWKGVRKGKKKNKKGGTDGWENVCCFAATKEQGATEEVDETGDASDKENESCCADEEDQGTLKGVNTTHETDDRDTGDTGTKNKRTREGQGEQGDDRDTGERGATRVDDACCCAATCAGSKHRKGDRAHRCKRSRNEAKGPDLNRVQGSRRWQILEMQIGWGCEAADKGKEGGS